MSELVKISNTEIEVKEYNGQRVCTFKDIDTVHGKSEEVANRNFNRNRKHFIEGEDFFRTNCREAKELFNTTAPTGLILITESGYLMLVKSFTDDLAWEVQRQLVKNYFRRADPKPEKQQETQLEKLNKQYIGALKSADECKDLKEYYYNAYLQNEKQYRKYLNMENEFKTLTELCKAEIRKYKEQQIVEAFKMTGSI